MFKNLLNKLIEKQNLTSSEMTHLIKQFTENQVDPIEAAGILVAFTMKGETTEELITAAKILKQSMQPFNYEPGPHDVDVVGTGGDRHHLFNVSTTAAFVVAAAGGRVIKHGSRAASGNSGSADVLVAAGLNLDQSSEKIKIGLEKWNIAFLFAPRHHPAFQSSREIRKTLGIPTLFNLLGPLLNPASVRRQLMGVSQTRWLKPAAEVLKALGSEHAMVVRSEEGLDEISCAGPTQVIELKKGQFREYTIKPEDFGLKSSLIESLVVKTSQESLAIIQHVLANKPGPARDIVLLNAAAGLYCADCVSDLQTGFLRAQEALASGKAASVFQGFIEGSTY